MNTCKTSPILELKHPVMVEFVKLYEECSLKSCVLYVCKI